MTVSIYPNGDGTYILAVSDSTGHALSKFVIDRNEVGRLMLEASEALYRDKPTGLDAAIREIEGRVVVGRKAS